MPHHEELLTSSEARLWKLIEKRAQAGAETERIDEHIWKLFGEEWAVMFTDLSGFSRRTAKFGITHFLQIIHGMRRLLFPVVADHCGFLVKEEADSLLLLFRTTRSALECAIAMQRACAVANERLVPEEQILLCVGIGHGRILRVGEHEAWGREVNAASKLGEDTAASNEILVTEAARNAAGDSLDVEYEDLGIEAPGSKQNYRVLYRTSR
jgi:class 3 adenylate cyclase